MKNIMFNISMLAVFLSVVLYYCTKIFDQKEMEGFALMMLVFNIVIAIIQYKRIK